MVWHFSCTRNTTTQKFNETYKNHLYEAFSKRLYNQSEKCKSFIQRVSNKMRKTEEIFIQTENENEKKTSGTWWELFILVCMCVLLCCVVRCGGRDATLL